VTGGAGLAEGDVADDGIDALHVASDALGFEHLFAFEVLLVGAFMDAMKGPDTEGADKGDLENTTGEEESQLPADGEVGQDFRHENCPE